MWLQMLCNSNNIKKCLEIRYSYVSRFFTWQILYIGTISLLWNHKIFFENLYYEKINPCFKLTIIIRLLSFHETVSVE